MIAWRNLEINEEGMKVQQLNLKKQRNYDRYGKKIQLRSYSRKNSRKGWQKDQI